MSPVCSKLVQSNIFWDEIGAKSRQCLAIVVCVTALFWLKRGQSALQLSCVCARTRACVIVQSPLDVPCLAPGGALSHFCNVSQRVLVQCFSPLSLAVFFFFPPFFLFLQLFSFLKCKSLASLPILLKMFCFYKFLRVSVNTNWIVWSTFL